MTTIDCTGNSFIQMQGAEGLKASAEALKPHKNIKQLLLGECEVGGDGAVVIADILFSLPDTLPAQQTFFRPAGRGTELSY